MEVDRRCPGSCRGRRTRTDGESRNVLNGRDTRQDPIIVGKLPTRLGYSSAIYDIYGQLK